MLSTPSLVKISRPSPGVFTGFQITPGTGSNKRLNISSDLKISGDLTSEMDSVRQTPALLGMGQVRKHIKRQMGETSLVVQPLRLCMANAGGAGLIPGQGTKIRQASKLDQKKKSDGSQSARNRLSSPSSANACDAAPSPARWLEPGQSRAQGR